MKWIKTTALAACLTVAACGPTPDVGTPTPWVEVVYTCVGGVYYFDVQYAGWYAVLSTKVIDGVAREGILVASIQWREAGDRIEIVAANPFEPFRVGWSQEGMIGSKWHPASNMVEGLSQCL